MRDLKTLSCKLPTPIHERYARVATAEGNQLSALVRRVLITALAQVERDAPTVSTSQPVAPAKRRA